MEIKNFQIHNNLARNNILFVGHLTIFDNELLLIDHPSIGAINDAVLIPQLLELGSGGEWNVHDVSDWVWADPTSSLVLY